MNKSSLILISILIGSLVLLNPSKSLSQDVKDLEGALERSLKQVESIPMDESSFSVEKKAAALGGTIVDIYSFVRDEIRFEPYPLQLRRPDGVLMAKAGNALERALLLMALCECKGFRCRLVRGTLSPEKSVDLLKTVFRGSVPPEAFANLNQENISNPLQDENLLSETRDHFWVQYFDQEKRIWVDLDPSFKEGKPGIHFCKPDRTFVKPPPQLSPELTISVRLEEKKNGRSVYSTPLAFKDRLVNITYEPIHLVYSIGRERQGEKLIVTGIKPFLITPKKTIEGKLTGKPGKSPGDRRPFDRLKTALDQKDSQKEEPAPLEITRGWIEFTLSYPRGHTENWTYEVFTHTDDLSSSSQLIVNLSLSGGSINKDFFTAESRHFHKIYRDAIKNTAQLDVSRLSDEKTGSNLEDFRQGSRAATLGLMTLTRIISLHHAYSSDLLLEKMGRENGVTAYYAAPRMIITSVSVGEEGISLSLDLNRNQARILVPPGTPESLKFLLHMARGLRETALENELLELWTGKKSQGAAVLFALAQERKIPFIIFTPGQEEKLEEHDYLPLARVKMTEALSRGYIILAPERMMTIDNKKTISWWEMDGRTGELVSVSENGRHQAIVEEKIIKKFVEAALGSPTVFFGGIIAGFHIGSSAILNEALKCASNPDCTDSEQVCSQAKGNAEIWCEVWATTADLMTLDIWSLLGQPQVFSGGDGCKLGIKAALRVAGCK